MSKRGGFHFPTSLNPQFNEVRSGVMTRGSDPDYLYYNAQIINNSTSTTSTKGDPSIVFQDTRSVPILQDKSNYGISVENFTLNGAGKNLPVFIPQIREYNSDGSINTNPNNTVYDITFTAQYGGPKDAPTQVYQATRSIQWEPELQATWTGQPAPVGQFKYPQQEIDYYYCYTYSHWVKLINNALALAWNDVLSAAQNGSIPGDTIIINSLSGPKITLDDVTGTFVIGALVENTSSPEPAIAQIVSLSPFQLDILSGSFVVNDTIFQNPVIPNQVPDISNATGIITTYTPSVFTVGGTVQSDGGASGTVVSFSGNTLTLSNVTGEFQDGEGIFQEPDVAAANITKVTTGGFIAPGLDFGTKCPFYTYDPKTNLFSLYQDANTCVTPFGLPAASPPFTPSNPPSALDIFGISNASGYLPGEYSFIGYNTNFESLLTNFNTTYYSDQQIYPPRQLSTGVSINSPTGLETTEQSTAIVTDSANIIYFTDDQMIIQWTGPASGLGANWIFAPYLKSTSRKGVTEGRNTVFNLTGNPIASYLTAGVLLSGVASNDIEVLGRVVSYVSNTGILTLYIISTTGLAGADWTFTLAPITSSTTATPTAGVLLSLDIPIETFQTPLKPGNSVTVTGTQGEEFVANISSFQETFEYTGASAVSTNFTYVDPSGEPGQFNPIASYQAQNGLFDKGNIVQGQTSDATARLIDVTSANVGTKNTIGILNQTGSFTIGSTITDATTQGTAVITEITGPNAPSTVIKTGIISLKNTFQYAGDDKFYYSGPFAVGDEVQDTTTGTTAVITEINGDNGYTTVSFSQQKNPFVIGHTLECFASLASPGSPGNPLICSGTIVDIQGSNLGYGIMNFTNQNGKFGVGESIVDNVSGSVATIVAIQGDNNGYAYINYINQLTPDPQGGPSAPGSFVPGEFLAIDGVAFAQVVIDTQNVINQTEGNIGTVTCILGEEIGGIFYPTANAPVPQPGQYPTIVGLGSSTYADFGGIAYLDSGTLTLNNICGVFYVGDLIVDSVGYGLTTSTNTSQSTAICNGMSYLESGKLIVKNTMGGITEPAIFPTNTFIVDFESSGSSTATNPLVLQVSGIPLNKQFYQGNQVTGETSGAIGTVILNNGPVPFGSTDPTIQSITVLPNPGSTSFENGEVLQDTTPGFFLDVTLGSETGLFSVGDTVTQNGVSGQILQITPGFPAFSSSYDIQNIQPEGSEFTAGTIVNANDVISFDAKALYTGTLSVVNEYTSGTATSYNNTPQFGVEIINWNNNTTGTCNWSVQLLILTYSSSVGDFTPGDIILGQTSDINGIVYKGSETSTSQLEVFTYNGSFFNNELLTNETTNTSYSSQITNITVSPNSAAYKIQVSPTPNETPFSCSPNDSIGILPYETIPNGLTEINSPIIVSGANITLQYNSTIPSYNIGDSIYFNNVSTSDLGNGFVFALYATTSIGTITSLEPIVNNTQIINVALKSFSSYSGQIDGFDISVIAGIGSGVNNNLVNQIYPNAPVNCLVTTSNITSAQGLYRTIIEDQFGSIYSNTKNYVKTINYFTSGNNASASESNINANATITGQSDKLGINGIIDFTITSPSNGFVQTSKSPSVPIALNVTNITGPDFNHNDSLRDTTTLNIPPWSYSQINTFTNTTNYQQALTTLGIKNVVGSINIGDTVSQSAGIYGTVSSASFSDGQLILQAISGTLQPDEIIKDLGTQATATYISSINQDIQDLETQATATVLSDNGTQLVLDNVTGTFDVGNTIQGTLSGYTAVLSVPYSFSPGDTLTQGSSTATVVSDNGSKVVVSDISGDWAPGTFTDSTNSVSATITAVTNPQIILIPLNSTEQSGAWTILPTPLTSSTINTIEQNSSSTFTTNLYSSESYLKVEDTLLVTDVDSVLTVEQLYYPENVVQVSMSAGNGVVQTLQSLFPSDTSGPQYVVLVQDMESTSSLWSPVASIVIGTQFITVREEYSGTPITIGTGNLGSNASSGSFQKVLLETPIEVLPQESWRGLIFYEQKVEKMSSLGLSKEDLKNLDVQLYWRNRLTNSLVPLTLYNGGSANIRLLFKRIHE